MKQTFYSSKILFDVISVSRLVLFSVQSDVEPCEKRLWVSLPCTPPAARRKTWLIMGEDETNPPGAEADLRHASTHVTQTAATTPSLVTSFFLAFAGQRVRAGGPDTGSTPRRPPARLLEGTVSLLQL